MVRDSEPVSWSSILAGFRFVLNTNLILATITLDLLAVFLGGGWRSCRSMPVTFSRLARAAWDG